MNGHPILAHPESTAYRARKFVGRHRWGVAVMTAATLALAGYALTTTVQGRRIAAERDRAALESRKAGQVTEFMVELFSAADPNEYGGEEITVRQLLDNGARRLNDVAVEDPAVRSTMLTTIGRSYSQLGY